MTYDLVIKNGTVIDPAQGLHAKKDIAVAGGKIAAIEDYVSDGDTHDVIEANDVRASRHGTVTTTTAVRVARFVAEGRNMISRLLEATRP